MMKPSEVYEEISLRSLREKARRLLEEQIDEGTRGILVENLIEQAYYTGQRDHAFTNLEDTLDKAKGGV